MCLTTGLTMQLICVWDGTADQEALGRFLLKIDGPGGTNFVADLSEISVPKWTQQCSLTG